MAGPWEKYGSQQRPGVIPLGPPDQMRPLQVQGAQMGLRKDQIDIQQAPLDAQNKQLSGQKTQQEIQFERSKVAADLAGKFAADQRVKAYREVLPMVVSAMSAGPGKQGDLTVVYAWAKAMDPAGSVREGDTDLAQSSASFVQQFRSYLARVNEGKGLDADVRKNLIAEMRNKGHVLNQGYSQARQEFSALAQQGGIPANVVIGEHDGGKYQQVEANYKGAPVTNLDGGQGAVPTSGNTQTNIDPAGTASLDAFIKRGASFEEANKWVREQGGSPLSVKAYKQAVEFAKANPNYSGSLAEFTRTTQTTPFQQIAGSLIGPGDIGYVKGFKESLDRAATLGEGAYNAIVPESMESTSAQDAARATQNFFVDKVSDPTGETLGRFSGAGAMTFPFTGPMTAGALGNVLMTDSTGMGLVGDAALGAAGGKIGDMTMRGISQLVAPQLERSVTNLAREGAQLTPGRFFPGLKKAEDLARSYPIVGDKIDDALANAERSVARIPANRALGHIGQQLPESVPAGHEAAGHTERTIGNFFDANLNGRSMQLDPTLVTRLNYAGQRSPLRPQEFEQFNDIVQREVGGMFANGGGKASLRDWKRLDSKLGKMAAKFQASPDDPFKAQLGDQVEFLQDQLRHLTFRQNPDIANNLRAANKAWADFVPYQRATAMDLAEGIPTPAQYRAAVRQNDSSLRKGATARGDARMQDFAIDASKVIPAERGNSGTADRLNLTSAKAWLTGAAVSPLYSEPALKAINYLAKREPDITSERIANVMRSLPRGMFGPLIPLGVYSGQ